MRSIVKFATKLSMAGLVFCLSVSNVFANTLSKIEINSQDTGYGIVLTTDAKAQIKRTAASADKLLLELKDVNISENLDTIYNNVANIENVTVSPIAKNNIKIAIKGKNIANSSISFEAQSTAPVNGLLQTESEQAIQLSGPVSSYTPVYNPENFIEEEIDQTSNPQLNEVLTKMNISREMLITVKKYTKAVIRKIKNAANGDINILTIAGIALIIGAFAFKPGRKAQKPIPQKTIGIESRENIEREIGINRNLAENMNIRKNNSINDLPAVKSGYGMKAYQQSQKNPYMTANSSTNGISGIARRKSLSTGISTPIKKQTLNAKPVTRESAPLKQDFLNNPIKKSYPKIPSKTASLNNSTNPGNKNLASTPSDLDSMKFLESITKIYENSGRTDLAKGLKDNLRKAQLTKL